MEPQQQVVEGVIANICEKLGSDAKEHICLDNLCERAKFLMENNSSVPEAIEAISSPLKEDVQGKLEEKNNIVKKIRDELEKTSKPIIIEEIKKKLEQDTEHLQGAPCPRDNESSAPGPHTTTQLGSASAEKVSDLLVSKTGTSDCIDSELPHEGKNKVDSDDDDVEVIVLSTVPRQLPPLIVLTDDSCDGTYASSSDDGGSVMKLIESQENPKPHTSMTGQDIVELDMGRDVTIQQRLMREQEIDIKDGENSVLINKSLANLHRDEIILNERINEIKSEEKRNIDNIDCEVKDMKTESQRNDRLEIDVLQQPSPEDAMDEVGSHDTDQTNPTFLSEKLEPQSPNPPAEAKLNTCIDENSNSTSIADVINFVMNGHPEGIQSSELWEDAHYVCSLLPYFTLRDVYQTMVDNVHHPDRRAFVLEAYINLAVDRQEPVQDVVFQGLWAARKRSHGELADPLTYTNKKRRTEDNSETNMKGLKEQTTNAPHEVLPSTSTAGCAPLLPKEPDVATSINSTISGSSIDDPIRDGWYKEKMEFLCAVVQGVSREVLWAQVLSCQTDADVEALMERVMEEQDQDDNLTTASAMPHHVKNQPSTSAVQSVAVAGPSNVAGTKTNVAGDETVAGPSSEEAAEAEDHGGQATDLENRILTQVKTLSEMFTDADPDYLQERCVTNGGDEAKFQEVMNELLERKDYPKIEEYHKRQKRLEIKKKFIEGMSVEEFLEYFEDPEKVFSDTSTAMSATYIENARTQLKRDLPFHLIRDIESALKKHSYHYLPTLRALNENKKLARRKTKRTSNLKERDLDDIFIKELCYVRMQESIKEHLWKKEENKKLAFRLAKATHQLQECQCCCHDEVLEEDMEPCSSQNTPHKFCVNCIRRFVEEEIGQGRTSFRCLEGDCKAEFSLTTLKKVMKPSIFSKILERKQLEEIAAAGIEDLVACPFCNFQTIMPNPEDKVFKCLNPECMKDSCRYCKEPNHVPLHCEEVEKQHQKDTRVFLENKMTEAMVRVCWKCKKRFIKEDGCNKMVCSCGAMMCYICKKAIKGYDHFEDKPNPSDSRKCPLWSNSKVIHAEEVRAAATKLKNELDPSLDLLHNPLQDLPEVPQHLARHQGGQPAQPPHVPHALQQQIQAHQVAAYHYQPHGAHIRRNQAAFHLPAPPPPPAHRQLPPAPPAHRQLPPALAIGVMRPPPVVNVPEANQFQHQHHHHFHHHHIHPVRQNTPPVHLPPTRPLRDNLAHIADELLMEIRRNQEMHVRNIREQWEAMDQVHGAHQQQ